MVKLLWNLNHILEYLDALRCASWNFHSHSALTLRNPNYVEFMWLLFSKHTPCSFEYWRRIDRLRCFICDMGSQPQGNLRFRGVVVETWLYQINSVSDKKVLVQSYLQLQSTILSLILEHLKHVAAIENSHPVGFECFTFWFNW